MMSKRKLLHKLKALFRKRKLWYEFKALFRQRYIDRWYNSVSINRPEVTSLSNSLSAQNKSLDTCVKRFEPKSQTTQAYVINHTQQLYPKSRTYECVVFDERRNPLPYSSYWRPTLLAHIPAKLNNIKFEKIKTEPHIYLGLIEPLQGFFHFLLETLPRLWVLNAGDINYKIAINKMVKDERELWKQSPYAEYFDVLGFTEDKITIIDQPTIFENLIIPSPAAILSLQEAFYSTELIEFWEKLHAKLKRPNIDSPEYIYMSRRQVKNPLRGEQRRLINEAEVEDSFKELGFTIVSPEQLTSESEKHSLLDNCKFIAGTGGSGLLQAAFLPQCKNVLVIENYQDFPCTVRHQLMMSVLYNQKIHVFDSCDPLDSTKRRANIEELKTYVLNILDNTVN